MSGISSSLYESSIYFVVFTIIGCSYDWHCYSSVTSNGILPESMRLPRLRLGEGEYALKVMGELSWYWSKLVSDVAMNLNWLRWISLPTVLRGVSSSLVVMFLL